MEIYDMRYILAMVLAVFFIGCSSSKVDENVEAKLVVGKSLADLKIDDQQGVQQVISQDTKIVFFSFSKKVGHICNKFLESKSIDFLAKHNTLYVADVSPAPSIIKNMFILPDLKELKFPILLINDDQLSAEYSKDMNKENIVVVFVENKQITKITNIKSKEDLEILFQK
jgi:hypothetical protein